jgi:apolipoprotein N-acyltransferase
LVSFHFVLYVLNFSGAWSLQRGVLFSLELNRSKLFLGNRYLWGMAAGFVLAASFPKMNVAGFAWVAPALILFAAFGKSAKQAFRIGYVAGVTHYLVSLYWLLLIPVPWTWKWAPMLGWMALSGFLALGIATWTWLGWKLFPGEIAFRGSEAEESMTTCVGRFLVVSWVTRTVWCLACAALWVSIEMIIARVFGGFPWNLLGASQYRMIPLIQIASLTAVYGVSFLLVWSSLALLSAGMAIVRKPAMRSAWIGEIILPMAVVGFAYGAGYHRTMKPAPGHPELTVALIQPSIPQTLIWDEAGDEQRFQELLRLSEEAVAGHPNLVVWPEAAVPKMVRYYEDISNSIAQFATNHNVWMIIGSDDAEPHPHATTANETDFFNSSFLVNAKGQLVGRYVKQNLVMFGEYVPRWLPFAKYLTPIGGGFTPGNVPVPFHLENLKVNASVLICFEDVFPQLARKHVFDDTDFLVNLTNDGWFDEGPAQWQHAASAVFRAVENAVPLVRCSNNGLTCWVDSRGVIRDVFVSQKHGIYGSGYLTVRIPTLFPNENRAPTFYREHGDWFGWGCVLFTILRLGNAWFSRSKLGASGARRPENAR